MIKQLNIPPYYNGYTLEVSNCIDYSIAGASGHFAPENYFLYCAFYGIFSNFSDGGFQRDWALSQLGLQLVEESVPRPEQLFETIKGHIDRGEPVLVPSYYDLMFFHPNYRLPNQEFSHWMLLDGYDSEREILQLREYTINIPILEHLTKAQVFSVYYLTRELVEELYQKSAEKAKRLGDPCFCIYYLTLEGKAAPCSIRERLVRELSSGHDHLISIIEGMKGCVSKQEEAIIHYMRRSLYHSMRPVIDRVKEELHEQNLQELIEAENSFLECRYQTISSLHRSILKKQEPAEQRLEEMMARIREEGIRLWECLRSFSSDKGAPPPPPKIPPTGIAVTASSCHPEHPAECVLTQTETFWESQPIGNSHWLQFTFEDAVSLSQVTIRHHTSAFHITRDFVLRGSPDGIDWITLDTVENNNEEVTTHTLKNRTDIACRYYRLDITRPGEMDYCARIRQVIFYL